MNLDKKYVNFILDRTNIFQYTHPNFLSFTGLLVDFFILYCIVTKSIFFLGLFLFIRYSCDCLDGAVARKYNKVSDLGGALDTIADNTLIFIITYGILYSISFPYAMLVAGVVVSLNIIYMYKKKAILHHMHLEKTSNNYFDKIYLFGVNNNSLIYLVSYIIIVLITLLK